MKVVKEEIDESMVSVTETNELTPELKKEVMDYLNDLRKTGIGELDMIEDVVDEFNLSEKDAKIAYYAWAAPDNQQRTDSVEVTEDEDILDATEEEQGYIIRENRKMKIVKEDAGDNTKSRTESLKLTADYFLGQLRGLVDKVSKEDSEGAKLFFKNANNTLKDLVRQFEDLKASF